MRRQHPFSFRISIFILPGKERRELALPREGDRILLSIILLKELDRCTV